MDGRGRDEAPLLVRRAKTDALCHYRAAYAFSPVPRTTRFVFNAVVPEQN